MRICFFGDSFTHGTGDDHALGWVGRVLAETRQRGRDVTGYNLGVRRNTSADIATRWRSEAQVRLPAEYPCRVVFSFGTNDCSANEAGDGPRLENAQSLRHAEAILLEARSWLPTLMLGPASVANEPEVNERIRALSKAYATLCERLAVPYLELCQLTLASPAWQQEALTGDGAHPNRGGYALIADAVSKWPAWQALVESAR
ncbi:MAG: GDSL-type esterase/lipase family protein [Polyangiaceae bacterium]